MPHSKIASFLISALIAAIIQSSTPQRYPVAPDRSLAPTVYIQKGLPAHDRKWSGLDYKQAMDILQAIAAADATQLPRYNSPTSGIVFARIVSLDNLSLSRGDDLPLMVRLEAAAPILINLGQITAIYVSVTTTERVFDSELVELLRFSLEACRDIVRLTADVIASLPADDPRRQALAKSGEQMSQGLAQVVSGCLDTLLEKKTYRTSELIRLAQTIEQTLPDLIPALPPGTQEELPVRINRMIEQEPDPQLKEQLRRIAAGLAKSKKG